MVRVVDAALAHGAGPRFHEPSVDAFRVVGVETGKGANDFVVFVFALADHALAKCRLFHFAMVSRGIKFVRG